MGDLLDITEQLNNRLWNENVSEVMEACEDDPVDILITLEEHLRLA